MKFKVDELYKMDGKAFMGVTSVKTIIGGFKGANGSSVWFLLRYPVEVELKDGYTLKANLSRFSVNRGIARKLGKNFRIKPASGAEKDLITLIEL